jgi:hypothetical protein
MILEYSQLLCTAHRVLDGEQYIDASSGRRLKRWKLEDPIMESNLYKATHINHPSAVWTRDSINHYNWLYCLFVACCREYTYRYGKRHKCEDLIQYLVNAPMNIPHTPYRPPTPAMPEEYKVPGDSLKSYHNYYIGAKQRMLKYTKRDMPEFLRA